MWGQSIPEHFGFDFASFRRPLVTGYAERNLSYSRALNPLRFRRDAERQIDARNVVSSVAEQLQYLLAGLQLRVTLVEKVLLPLRRAGVAQTVKRHRPGEACPPSQSNVIFSSLSMAFGLGRGTRAKRARENASQGF